MDSKVEINQIQKHFRSNFRWKYAKKVNKKLLMANIRFDKVNWKYQQQTNLFLYRVILLKKKNY